MELLIEINNSMVTLTTKNSNNEDIAVHKNNVDVCNRYPIVSYCNLALANKIA